MIIGIDASRYSHESATGVEWYSWHIINALKGLVSEKDELVFYSRGKIDGLGTRVLPARRLWTLVALSREMCKNPPDVLFVPSHTLPPSLPKRSVIMIHDLAFKILPQAYTFFQRQHLHWSTKRAVKCASAIIVPSEATKTDLINFYNCLADKIVVIPHGFTPPRTVSVEVLENSEIFKYFGIDKSMKYLLFVGRLESKKNLVNLVEAFAEFAKKNPDFRLVLAGKRGVGFKKLLQRIDELDLMHKVIMPGYITEEEKSALYQHCRAFVFPSLYEGFGLPILEAFHYGKPVLTSNISSMPEVGGEAAYYVDPHSVESIEKGLEVISKDDDYVRGLVKSGTERLKNYSWEKAAQATLKVLHG